MLIGANTQSYNPETKTFTPNQSTITLQKQLIELTLSLGAEINSLSWIPNNLDITTYEFLLDNGLTADKLLKIALKQSVTQFDHGTNQFKMQP